jgi:hypothetical protein
MKNIKWSLLLIVSIICIFAFTHSQNGIIRGSVNPADAATTVWAISGKDTFRTNIVNGKFELRNVKTGNYTIGVQAVPPYKNYFQNDVIVAEGNLTDIGEIMLQK